MARNLFILIVFLLSLGTVYANKIKPSAHADRTSSEIIIDGIFLKRFGQQQKPLKVLLNTLR